MDELSQRFLTAFNSIEDFLRRQTRSDNRVSFYALIAAAEKTHPGVRRNANDLRAYGDLRNAVAHRYDIERPLATPNGEAVDVFEKICEQILKPPVVGSFFNSAVTTASWDDRIGPVVQQMYEGDFSQVPVQREGKLVALLTAETVARWLAGRFQRESEIILESEPVSNVLEFTEPTTVFEIISRNTPVVDAIASFEDHYKSGKSLDAIIITHNGRNVETPTGIVTISDMPKLHGSLTI